MSTSILLKCSDDGIVTSSKANCKQGLTANKQVKKDYSPEISTTKCNDNADKEYEESKKHTDTMCKSPTLTACSVMMTISWWWQQK